MHSEPAIIEPTPGEPAPRPSGRSVDAELVLAAIDRMEAAIARDRVALDHLHAGLAAMAQTIAQAKIAMQLVAVKPDAAPGAASLDVAVLLDELEHRVDAMLEIGTRRGRENAPAEEPASAEPADPDRDASDVAVLEAMVLALSALDVVNQPGTDDHEGPAAETGPPSALTPAPSGPITPESDLLGSFARMEAFPIPQPDIGTAVIFSPRMTKPTTKIAPPEVDLAAASAAPPDPGTAPTPTASDAAARSDTHPDPLAALKSMSAAEKIALFS